MIRLPDVSVPLGTHTGWNVYADPALAPGSLSALGILPALRERSRREAIRGGSPSVADGALRPIAPDYAGRVREAVDALVAARLLLREDGEAYVQRAVRTALEFQPPAE